MSYQNPEVIPGIDGHISTNTLYIIQTAGSAHGLRAKLKHTMAKLGLDPSRIDDPDAVLPNQVGSGDRELKNDAYAKGLRYSGCGGALWRFIFIFSIT